jgi:hypothetical protein
MKILLTLIVACFISSKGIAQIEKRTILLGGNASMVASIYGNSFLNCNPNVGIFINDNVCLGATTSIMLFNEEFFWGAAPFARYYFSPKKTQSFYSKGSIGFSNLNVNYVGVSAGFGHVWFINKSVGFETELVASTDSEEFSAGIYLGLQVFLNRNKKEH